MNLWVHVFSRVISLFRLHILTKPRVPTDASLHPGLLKTVLSKHSVELLFEKTSESGTTSSRRLAPDMLMSDVTEWQMSHINLFRSIEGPLTRFSVFLHTEGPEQHQTNNCVDLEKVHCSPHGKGSRVCPYEQPPRRGWTLSLLEQLFWPL